MMRPFTLLLTQAKGAVSQNATISLYLQHGCKSNVRAESHVVLPSS